MSDVSAVAAKHFAAGYNCAQSVLKALAGHYGLDEETAVRLATGFGVGMARGGICGAVSGAVMVLGLAGGGGGPNGANAKVATYSRARDFYSRFTDRHGSCICRELIGLDPSTPEGLEQARREKRFQAICLGLVRDAATLAQAVIEAAPVTVRD
jgi:C_GCAxxG_C_C family probable redox protein